MATKLDTSLTELAQAFAKQVIDAVRSMTLDEVLALVQSSAAKPHARAVAPVRRGPGRPPRDASDAVNAIVALLQRNRDGLRAEQIRAELRLAKPEGTRAITRALEARAIRKTGRLRATRYFAQ